MAANASVEVAAKAAEPRVVEKRLQLLLREWPQIAAGLRRRLPEPQTVRRWLEAAGAPATAEAIGVPRDKHARDYARARLIRRRFTGLDVLHELGLLDVAVAEMFGVNGFWRESRAVA